MMMMLGDVNQLLVVELPIFVLFRLSFCMFFYAGLC